MSRPSESAARPSPGLLYMQAQQEVLDRHGFAGVSETTREHRDEIRTRYLELMREHGHIIPVMPDDPYQSQSLPCGWPGPVNPEKVPDA